ncbi:glycoside hydrolase family 16 protein [Spirosoma fluviale]|nr:glycoside hydrolase family 16 protein [Spirosoma fluviale]
MKRALLSLTMLFSLGIFTAITPSCRQVVLYPLDPVVSAIVCQTDESNLCSFDYATSADSLLAKDGWGKAFDDNFDKSPADPTNPNWRLWIGGSFNNELQLYTNNPENIAVTKDFEKTANNLLVIKAKKRKVKGYKYRQDIDETWKEFDFTSARIESKALFMLNDITSQLRVAARIKLPTGYGMGASFWSYGDNWPTNGGIAIIQARGHDPYNFQNAYFYDDVLYRELIPQEGRTITSTTNLTDRWHVYEMIWQKDTLTFLLDGQVIDTKQGDYVANLFEKPQRITLNQVVGGDLFLRENTLPTADQIVLNGNEGIMQVDWVKVYAKN